MGKVTRVTNPGSRESRFKTGDWVSFIYGARQVWAQVVEDRGPIGVKGRRLYRVRIGCDQDDETAFEAPEDELSPIVPDLAKVIEYLKNGGLIAILRLNLGGGPGEVRVWLSFNSHGELTHTLFPERGFVGGRAVPFFALQGDRVFEPKSGEVTTFLTSLGLDIAQAEAVIQAVGCAPP